jgi:hypothetical protein
MPDKQFGKGFAQKHFADKQFATATQGRAVALLPAVVTVAGQTITVTRGSERLVQLVPAVVSVNGQTLQVSRGREVDLTPAVVTVSGQLIGVFRGGRQVDLIPAQVALLGVQLLLARGREVNLIPAQVDVAGATLSITRGSELEVGYLDAKVIVLPARKLVNKASAIYPGNNSILRLENLVDREKNPVTIASVTLQSFLDATGDTPSGLSLPLTLQHTTEGNYEAALPNSIDLTPGNVYKAKVRAVAGSVTGEWTETVLAMRRVA